MGPPYIQDVCNTITDLQKEFKNSTIWIAGAMNLPDINWNNNTVTTTQYPLSINRFILDTLYDTGLEQVIKFPTRGNNTLDIFMTNHPSLVLKCKVIPDISDHDIVLVEIAPSAPINRPLKRKILLWKDTNLHSLRNTVLNFSSKFVSSNTTQTLSDQPLVTPAPR